MDNVVVLDENGQLASKTNPAMARKMLKRNEVSVVSKNPFIIQFNKTMMTSKNNGGNIMERLQIQSLLSNEQTLYLQNISGGIVSIEFRNGDQLIPFRLANTREPICITDAVPFDILKKDFKFRELLNRGNIGKPEWVRVFTQEQYADYLERRSAMLNTSKEEVVQRGADIHNQINHKQVPAPDDKPTLRDEVKDTSVLSEADVILPKILGVCQSLHPEADNKIDPIDALDIFESILDISEDDLNYIISHSYNEIIKKWALKKQLGDEDENTSKSFATSNTIVREIDDQRNTPPVIKKAKPRGRPKKNK